MPVPEPVLRRSDSALEIPAVTVEPVSKPPFVLETGAASPAWTAVVLGVVRSMRAPEWLKNVLVFAAAVFSGDFFAHGSLLCSFLAFVALCLVASATYLFNDVKDREADKFHPEKKLRPVAAGLVRPSVACSMGLLLALSGVVLAFSINTAAGLGILGYVVLTTAYTVFLKSAVILDVLTLASVFVLRVIIGALAANRGQFSSWLVLCTFLLALFLGFAKRRNELVLLNGNAHPHRPVLVEYSPYFLDMMMAVVTTATVISYALYTMAPETLAHFHSRGLIYTSLFVLYGIFRYLYLVHQRRSGGNPVQVFYGDRPLQITVLLWAISIFALRYA